ncbi:hypothetical protein [Azotobacter vinelandii]|uniref:hypothetical protein n=1 Tax=Azotobacter vinelandii TaxID=354 RepID=UPI0007739E40|nr:hypothetical protein [Azotobacter vinelandii]
MAFNLLGKLAQQIQAKAAAQATAHNPWLDGPASCQKRAPEAEPQSAAKVLDTAENPWHGDPLPRAPKPVLSPEEKALQQQRLQAWEGGPLTETELAEAKAKGLHRETPIQPADDAEEEDDLVLRWSNDEEDQFSWHEDETTHDGYFAGPAGMGYYMNGIRVDND